jgi:hypothetical protein
MALAFSASLFAAGWVHVAPADKGFDIIKNIGSGNESYTRFGEVVILQGGDNFSDEVQKTPDVESFAKRDDEHLYLLTTKDPAMFNYVFPGARVVWSGFGMKVLLAGEVAAINLISKSSPFTKVELLPENQTILTAETICKKAGKAEPDEISNFLDLLDMQTFFSDLEKMVAVKTRYSYVDGAQNAIELCAKEFAGLNIPCEQVAFNIGSKKVNNLVATIKGSDEKNYGEVLVVGHLDSTSENPRYDAPGADDNGSGSAGVLALARMLKKSGLEPKATIRFVLFLGEEQGLYGSKAYVRNLNSEDKAKIKAVLNLDMIGFDAADPLSIMLETNSFNRPMVEKMQELAEKYAEFTIRTSFSAWGSDHAPFLQQRIPAVLTIESEYSSNPNYHKTTDIIESINPNLCENILRLNAATMFIYAVNP